MNDGDDIDEADDEGVIDDGNDVDDDDENDDGNDDDDDDDDDDNDAAGWYALGRDGEKDMLDGTPPNNGDASTANASEAMAVHRRSRGDEIMLL